MAIWRFSTFVYIYVYLKMSTIKNLKNDSLVQGENSLINKNLTEFYWFLVAITQCGSIK